MAGKWMPWTFLWAGSYRHPQCWVALNFSTMTTGVGVICVGGLPVDRTASPCWAAVYSEEVLGLTCLFTIRCCSKPGKSWELTFCGEGEHKLLFERRNELLDWSSNTWTFLRVCFWHVLGGRGKWRESRLVLEMYFEKQRFTSCLSWAQHSFHWSFITSGSHVLSSLQTICTRIPSGISNSSTFWFGRLRVWHLDFTKLSGVCDKQLDKGVHWSPCLGVHNWLHYCTETRFPLTADQNQSLWSELESVFLRNKDVSYLSLDPGARCPGGLWRCVQNLWGLHCAGQETEARKG